MIETFLTSIVGSLTAIALLILVLKEWAITRLRASIDAEYERRHEDYKRNLYRIEKVELISELLSEWIKIPPDENIPREERTILNKLSFKCSLWLSPDLSKELSKVVQCLPGAKSLFQVLLMARNELIDDANIGAEHITCWDATHETKADRKTEQKTAPGVQ